MRFIWHFRKSPVLRSSRGNNPNADATRKSENFFQKSSVLIGSFIFSGVVGIKRKSKTVSGKVSKTCNTDGCTDEGTHKKQKVPIFQSKQLEQAQERISEISRMIKRLYEDNVNGKISDERFMELSADYEAEQAELKKRATALQAELDKSQAATVNAEKFMGIVRKHLAFEELTPTLLREMIEKIVVHECSYDENGTRRQDIEIYYSFVGKIDLPE